MFAKIAVLILSIGLIAGTLLTVRQQRIQAAHGLAKAQTRLAELDRELLRLRLRIAARITPDQIEARTVSLGGGAHGRLLPLSMERLRELTRREADEGGAAAVVLGSFSDQ